MDSFEDINDRIVYTKAKSKTEALSKKGQALKVASEGKNVAVIFGEHYHLYLAPGYDPYQIRKDIDSFLNPPKDASDDDSASHEFSSSKNTPVRDAEGKFVSKTETPKKKNFWDSLK